MDDYCEAEAKPTKMTMTETPIPEAVVVVVEVVLKLADLWNIPNHPGSSFRDSINPIPMMVVSKILNN